VLVLTSWDDGHPCDVRVAEMLAKHGLNGTFFVPATNREGKDVMSLSQLRHIDQGYEIGGHTLTHCYLKGIQNETARYEIFEGKKNIEDALGHALTGFCYPGGRYNSGIVQTVRDVGFEYARTVENMRFDLGKDRWRLPTSLQFFPHNATVLARNFLRYPVISKPLLVTKRFQQKNFVSFLIETAERCAYKNGVFHLWGHSWEIESYQLWNDLDTVLKALAGMASHSTTLAEAARQISN
jgi:peptidoglycan/xylan/chitin deacetylase (PgdA/CDA1 family)